MDDVVVPIDQTLPEVTAPALGEAIGRIASGPRHAKSLTREVARRAMCEVLDGYDEVRAALFLIALRMKRESDDEFLGVLDALLERSDRCVAEAERVVDIAEPYDGFVRTKPVTPWIAPVLAACGLPTVVHGLRELSPKNGVTAHQLLAVAGLSTQLSVTEAASNVADESIGWAYVDQSRILASLHHLVGLRRRLVKRTVLNTNERVIGPIRGARRTDLVIGYVHAPYRDTYQLLAKECGFSRALLLKGLEGGVAPPLAKASEVYGVDFDTGRSWNERIESTMCNLARPERSIESTRTDAAHAASFALSALRGEGGPMADAITYSAATCLWGLGECTSLGEAAERVRAVIENGDAYRRLVAFGKQD
jgi:anthranilate phosphoribosyltransferase